MAQKKELKKKKQYQGFILFSLTFIRVVDAYFRVTSE